MSQPPPSTLIHHRTGKALMQTALCIAGLLLCLVAGWILRGMRGRLLTEKEKQEMAALRLRLSELLTTVEAVNALVARSQEELSKPDNPLNPPRWIGR